MHKIKKYGRATFLSLEIYNFKLFFIGQTLSMSGTWMQNVAQAILILQLTGSGTALGFLAACQYVPIIFFASFGGLLADRFSKRKILFITQTSSGLLAFIQGFLVLSGLAQVWMIYLLALCLGIATAFDNPAKHTFIYEMVGDKYIKNAVSLNSTLVNLARVIGPTIAALLIPTVGLAACFFINGLSFLAVLIVLVMMHKPELHMTTTVKKTKGQLREGFQYVKSHGILRNVLIMMAIIGTFTFEFSTILPLLAKFTFQNGTQGFALLYSALGFGSALGGLYSASRTSTSLQEIIKTAFLFGGFVILAAFSPNLIIATALMICVGFLSIIYLSLCNSLLQITSSPQMRGRVMALWSITLLGSTPFGGPIIGWIGEFIGPRWGLATGGIAAIGAALLVSFFLQKQTKPLPQKVVSP